MEIAKLQLHLMDRSEDSVHRLGRTIVVNDAIVPIWPRVRSRAQLSQEVA